MSYTVAEAQRAITELYVGIFNRAPDPEGLAYWTGKLVDEGADIDVVRAAFVDSVEWQNGVGQSTNAQVIQHLYESLFEREPEQEGFEFWLNELETGVTTVDQIVAVLIANASAYDQLTLDNKVDAALYYTIQSGGDDMVNDAGFNGAAATQAVDSVDYTTESLEASRAATDRALEDSGSVFALTEDDDEILEGTQYDDIFRGALNETLNGFDTIDGGDGNDTLEVVVRAGDGNSLGIPGFVDVRDVETLTLDIVNGGIDIELVGGDNFDDALNTVNVYSTGGTAEEVRVEADVDEINIGMVRADDGTLTERGVIESYVLVDVVDADPNDTDTSVAISTDNGAEVNSTGNLAAVNVTADGQNISGDNFSNDIYVTAEGDIASVTTVAGDDTYIDSLNGNIGSVNATGSFDYTNSNITIVATPDDPASAEGNITSVVATSPTGIVSVSALNDIDDVVARGDDGVSVTSTAGDIGSVVVPGWTVNSEDNDSNYVTVRADNGTVGSVDALASGNITVDGSDGVGSVVSEISGTGSLDVDSEQGSVGTVTHQGGASVNIYASDDIGSVVVDDITGSMYVYAEYGDIDSVVATEVGNLVRVEADDGEVGSVSADAGGYVGVYASDDVGSVDATSANFFVDVMTDNGDIGSVNAEAGTSVYVESVSGSVGSVTAEAGTYVDVYASDGLGSLEATAGTSVYVNVDDGAVGSVTAEAGTYVDIEASDDIDSVTATAGTDIFVESWYGDIGSVVANASDDAVTVAYNGSIGSVDASGVVVGVAASDDIGTVNADANYGYVASANGDIGDVTITADATVTGTGGYDAGDGVAWVFAQDGSIGSVVANTSDGAGVYASDDIGSVSGFGDILDIAAGGDLGDVTWTSTANFGENHIDAYNFGPGSTGEDELDVRILGAGSVGDVSITQDNSDEGLDVFVASLGTVGSVSIDAGAMGEDTNVDIDIHAQADTEVDVSLTADSDASFDLFVGSVTSDTSTSPETLNLTLGAPSAEGAGFDVYIYHESMFQSGSDESSVLATINVDGDADATLHLDSFWENSETLRTLNGADATGDLTVYMDVRSDGDTYSVSTGSGDDVVDLDLDDVTSDAFNHGAITVSTGAGNDTFTNEDGDDLYGSLTVNTGAGSDDVYVQAGSDATVVVSTGDDDDTITIYADEVDMIVARLGQGGEFAALTDAAAYVDVNLDIDAGDGDDVVEIYANRDSIEAGSFAMGDGMNTLRFDYVPDGQPVWSDADVAAFNLDNTSGSIHTLGVDAQIYISDDVTLDLTHNGGEGRVSVLETAGFELAGDASDGANGATLTIEGAADDFTLIATSDLENGFDDEDDGDIGDSDNDEDSLDRDALRLSTPGVVNLTIEGDEVGVILYAEDNESLQSVSAFSNQDDDVDVALVGFTGGLDVTAESLTDTGSADDTQVFLFGGEYGTVTARASDDETTVTIEAVDDAAGIDIGDYSISVDAIVVDASDLNGGSDADSALVTIDGVDFDGEDSFMYGTANVDIGTISLTGDHDSRVEIHDLSDGSSVEIDAITINMREDDESYGDGGVQIDDFSDTDITIGSIDIDMTKGDSVDGGFFEDNDVYVYVNWGDNDSTVNIGNITIDEVLASDSVDGYWNDVYVEVNDNEDTDVVIGDITANLVISGFDLEIDDNDNTNVTIGAINATGEDGSVDITNNEATTDGSTVMIDVESITMHDSVDDGFGPGSLYVYIANNDDDFTAGTMNVSVGDITLSGSDSAYIDINENDSQETDQFGPAITPLVGVQISVGDIDIAMGQGDAGYTQVDLDTNDNDGANIQIGNVTATLGDAGQTDGSSEHYFYDETSNNDWSAVERGDTSVTIIGDDDEYVYAWTEITGNDDASVSFGDYSITVTGSDGAESIEADIYFDVVDNGYEATRTDSFETTVEIGDVTLTLEDGVSDSSSEISVYFYDNDDSTITVGDITATSPNADVYVGFTDHDYATLSAGDVTMSGDDLEFYLHDNTNTEITVDSVTMTGDDLYVRITDNDTDSTIMVGDVTLNGVDSFFSITDNDGSGVEITVGDVSLTGMTDGGIGVHFSIHNNDDITLSVSDVTLSEGSDGNAYLAITDNDTASVTLGAIDIDTSDGNILVTIQDNDDDAVISLMGVDMTSSSDGDVDFDIGDESRNDDAQITVGNLTMDGYDADVYVNTGDAADKEDYVSISDVTITATNDVNITLYGDASDNFVGGDAVLNVGDIDITIDGMDDGDNEVDINAYGVTGMGTITVSGAANDVDIDIEDVDGTDDTSTATSLIDLSGMTTSDADIYIDFADTTGGDGTAGDSANLENDVVIRFGDFGSAEVITLINDHEDQFNIVDGDGVRQTYSFEGSDIGDITIQGFVAGAAAYRDVDIDGSTADGRGTGDADPDGLPGSDYFDYDHGIGDYDDGLVLLRTDRLDFSQFENVTSLENLRFEYDDDTDSVIITAADDEFSGQIVVTGVGVDADNGDSVESIIDRVADSIIFG